MKELVVKNITKFADAVEIIFDNDHRILNRFQHLPGQYVTLKINIDGTERTRAYSLTGRDHKNTIKICVKRVINGTVSNFLYEKLKIGDRIKVDQPEGDFVLSKNDLIKDRNYVFITGGSGITPIIPMMQELVEFGQSGKIILIYGNRDVNSILYNSDLKDLEEYAEILHVLHSDDESGHLKNVQSGILSKDVIGSLIEEACVDLKNTLFFLSGPPIVVNNSEEVLNSIGVEITKIRKEQFFIDSMQFADGKKHRIRVRTKDRFLAEEVESYTSILDACLVAGKRIDHSCRVGECKKCSCKLLRGTVNQNGEIISKKQQILSCQSFPLTEDVIVDFKKNSVQKISHYRTYSLLSLMIIGVFLLIGARNQMGDDFIAIGPMNTGHSDLSCIECHKNEEGNVRQQLQSKAASLFHQSGNSLNFINKSIENKTCTECHSRQDDVHPVHRFNEPKFDQAKQLIQPNKCTSCHMEHYGTRVTKLEPDYCMHCHGELKIKNDPISPTHEKIISNRSWESCLQCHDYHGNHIRKTPESFADTISKADLKLYFDGGRDPYSIDKREQAKTAPKDDNLN